jgi:hypothetical protein
VQTSYLTLRGRVPLLDIPFKSYDFKHVIKHSSGLPCMLGRDLTFCCLLCGVRCCLWCIMSTCFVDSIAALSHCMPLGRTLCRHLWLPTALHPVPCCRCKAPLLPSCPASQTCSAHIDLQLLP